MAITKTSIQERAWGDVFDVIDRVATEIDAGGASVQAADITDSTAIGRTVLTAADASAVRTAIGTVAATTAVAGIVKQITFTAQQTPDFADLAAVTVAYNALLTKFITAGLMPAA